MRELAEHLLGGAVVPRNLQYFNKPAGDSRPTPPHQDGAYFMLEPCEAVTLWLALDDVDEENGCVRFVRGSHTNGLREHARTDVLGFSRALRSYPCEGDGEAEVPVAVSAGELVAHHPLTVHRADANRSSSRCRRALGLIYYSARAREDVAAHDAYQAALAEELRGQGRI